MKKTTITALTLFALTASVTASAGSAKHDARCDRWGQIATDLMMAKENGHDRAYLRDRYVRPAKTERKKAVISHLINEAFEQPKSVFTQARLPAAADFGAAVSNRCKHNEG